MSRGTENAVHAAWSADELIPFGSYVLLDRISSGATAAVYRAAAHGVAHRPEVLAIKRILPHMAGDADFLATFIAEAQTVGRLQHPNICPIFELGRTGESVFMAMEWVPGKDLGQIAQTLAARHEGWPALLAAWIGARVCEALDHAHNLRDAQGRLAGIVHRDLSPANVLVSYAGEVKLIDFGVAKAVGRAQQTNVDALKRKLRYMSPEMVKGRPVDARSDVFAAGILLYEMLTGHQPFGGQDHITTLKLVGAAAVPHPSTIAPGVPPALEEVVMRALQLDPKDRYQTAGHMADALLNYVAGVDARYRPEVVSAFMDTLFADVRAEEQVRLHRLLQASRDPHVMAERQRFFATPAEPVARAFAGEPAQVVGQAAEAAGQTAPWGPAAQDRPQARRTIPDGVAAPGPRPGGPPPLPTARPGHRGRRNTASSPRGAFSSAGPLSPPIEERTEIFFNQEQGIVTSDPLDEVHGQPGLGYGAPPDTATADLEAPHAPGDRAQAMEPPPGSGPAADHVAAAEPRSPGQDGGQPAKARSRPPVARRERRFTRPPVDTQRPAGQPPPQVAGAPPRQSRSGVQIQPFRSAPLQETQPGVRYRALTRQEVWANRMLTAGVVLLGLSLVGLLFRTPLGSQLAGSDARAATLEIRTVPAVGAGIRLDDIYRGEAPLRLDNVPPGLRTVRIEARGFQPVVREVILERGSAVLLEVSLSRQDASAAHGATPP